MTRVVIYTTSYCPFCRAAKGLLQNKNVPFQEINVENDPEKRKWLKEVTSQMTVPQIFVNDQSIGGFQELIHLDQADKLDSLLQVNPK